MKKEKAKRVGVVASDPLRLTGLEAILNAVGLEAVPLTVETLFAQKALDAVVLEARQFEDGPAEMLLRLRRELPTVKVIVLGWISDPAVIQTVIGAGAKGYLLETAAEAEIRMALEVVLDNSVWAPRKVLARLIDDGRDAARKAESICELMTPREREVLRLLMDGCSNRAIAAEMGIDETTVKAHLGRMLRKTGAANRVELTLRAMEEQE